MEELICKNRRKCSGCQLLNMTYSEQLSYKQAKVIGLLGRFCHVDEIIGMKTPYHYRNKVQSAFAFAHDKKVISGVYQSKTKTIAPVKNCLIDDVKADKIVLSIRKLLGEFKIAPFDERSGRGILRHVLVRRFESTNEILVALVTAGNVFPSKKNFVNALLKEQPEITTIVHVVNNSDKTLMLNGREQILYGKGKIYDVLCGKNFIVGAKSFYQVNSVQTEKLYKTAIDFAEFNGNETVLDAYCGVGTIGIIASDYVKNIVGFEINEDAVKNANENVELNKIQNAQFFNCDARSFMSDAIVKGKKFDAVFLDPPRAGCDKNFLTSLIKCSPEKIIYVSCNPETQKRDMLYLTKNGYRTIKIQPFDMFPHTAHVESVVLITRVKD